MFISIHEMKSAILLVDESKILWVWYNNESNPVKYSASWVENEKVVQIGHSMYRATVYLESKRFVTFYDKCFAGIYSIYFDHQCFYKQAVI